MRGGSWGARVARVAAVGFVLVVGARAASAQRGGAAAWGGVLGRAVAAGASGDAGVAAPSASADASGANAGGGGAYVLPAQVTMRSVSVPGTTVRAGVANAEVPAPFETLAAVLLDIGRYREVLPRIDQSRVMQRRRGELDAYFSATLLQGFGTLWARTRMVITRSPGHLRIEGAMLEGNLARFELRVEASAVPNDPGRSTLEVQLLGLPQLPLPASLLDGVLARWAARGLGGFRDRAVQSARAASPVGASAPVGAPSAGPSAAVPAATATAMVPGPGATSMPVQ